MKELESLKQEVERVKKLPMFSKAQAAERLVERSIYIIELLEQRISKLEALELSKTEDYFQTDSNWQGVVNAE